MLVCNAAFPPITISNKQTLDELDSSKYQTGKAVEE